MLLNWKQIYKRNIFIIYAYISFAIIYSIAYAIILSHIVENLYKMLVKINARRLHEKFLLSQKCEKGKRGLRWRKIREFDSTDTKRTSRDWCHFLPGMLSGRLLLLMECFVRARNPGEHSRPSRERDLSTWVVHSSYACII